MRIRGHLRISRRRQEQATYAMEVGLVVLFFIGMERGNVGIMVNTAVGILVTRLPSVLERDHGVVLDPGLALWITSAAFFHALGVTGLPGDETQFYDSVWWWDHMTHALSSSVVAGAGYATIRAIDEHDPGVDLPPRFMFVFILMFVMAFGVVWEVVEFLVSLAAAETGTPILVQYGLDDTMADLLYNTAGGLLVAIWGTVYLTDLSAAIGDRLWARSDVE